MDRNANPNIRGLRCYIRSGLNGAIILLGRGRVIAELIKLYARWNYTAMAQRLIYPREQRRIDHAEIIGESEDFRPKTEYRLQYGKTIEEYLPDEQPVIGKLAPQSKVGRERDHHEQRDEQSARLVREQAE